MMKNFIPLLVLSIISITPIIAGKTARVTLGDDQFFKSHPYAGALMTGSNITSGNIAFNKRTPSHIVSTHLGDVLIDWDISGKLEKGLFQCSLATPTPLQEDAKYKIEIQDGSPCAVTFKKVE
ncbi:MAG: hypothetical protein BGO67_04560 [Alphaproteobacteria bacterium 41-28]|nr:MAG: hypothetical protein BGO67_04560 [Alphaproteobacteria bacterium 41-28]